MDKKKSEKTTQEMDLKQRRLKENMLLKELLTKTQPISADSAEESQPTTSFVVPEVYRETVEEMKAEYPDASEQDLVELLKMY